ncbi:MAG: SDR family oxidoreductase [Rhodospirillales bacterium]|nr:SDR family oxidoreductase [Rhodospirillales bacterium]MBO6788776.1 SDR family oxidoreductase [Rhodospirillales bacterium]
MTDQPLAGQVAVVTGAAKNIGRETAMMLAADGASVVTNGKTDEAAAKAAVAEIEAAGGRAIHHMADIADPDQAEGLIAAAVDAFGRLDILVLNAGIRRQHSIIEIPLEEWREVMTMDLESPFVLAKAAIPHMLENGHGRIVTLGGTSAHTGNVGRAHVGAAKMGLLSLTRSIAMEFGPQGITANMVAPGHIDTVRGDAAGERSSSGAGRPIGRMGTTVEIAAMIRHLCRPEGAYITGQCLHVDGGIYLGGA